MLKQNIFALFMPKQVVKTIAVQVIQWHALRARTNGQTDKQTNGCYQFYYLPASWSINILLTGFSSHGSNIK